MVAMRYRLAAIDLDGTLLGHDGAISRRSCDAVARAADAGIDIVLVTARGPRTVGDIAAELGVSGEAICSNGAIVLDLQTSAVLEMRTIETQVARRLVEALRGRLPGISFAVEWEGLAREPTFENDWALPPDTRVDDALALVDTPPAKLILHHADHELEVLSAAATEIAGSEAFVATSGGGYIEISAAGVNKGSALAEICSTRGVTPDEVIAFGDQPNDIPMLAWAGHAVAVANAHPEVIAVADEVTGRNDEDGVAVALERLVSVA